MFLPYKDTNPTKKTSIVTIFLIISNIAIFLYPFFSDKIEFISFIKQFALIPVEIKNGNLSDSNWINPHLTFVTSMFMHASISHILFNMLFLWIFGNNIEDVMTPFRFIIFYLLTGVIGSLAFYFTHMGSQVSCVGASGAVSGILGAYLFLFPKARVHTIVFIFPMRLPAYIFLIVWFLGQLSGLLDGQGNVAWIAHVAGFLSGIVLYKFFIKRDK